MTAIYGFLGGKGGTGKSTLSINVAHSLARTGSRVLLIDADPQGSATSWLQARENASPFTLARYDKPTLHREIGNLSQGYDAVVIDGPPRSADILRSALLASSHVLIPVQPSGMDIWAQGEALSMREEAGKMELLPTGQKLAFIVSRKIGNSAIGRDFGEQIASLGFPVLFGTAQRVLYSETISEGKTVFETLKANIAQKEINQLVDKIKEL